MNLDHLFSVMNTEALTKKNTPHINHESVTLANSNNLLAANDHLKLAAKIEPLNKGISEITIPKTVRQPLTAQFERLKFVPTALGGGEVVNTQIEESSRPEVLGELKPEPQQNGAAPTFYRDAVILKNEDNRVEPNFWLNSDRYTHCITCNQCEHLALTTTCKRLGKRVLPQALRECDSFNLLKSERISPVEPKPYTHVELERLLNQAAKPLYFHLIDCEQCSLEDTRYCGDGFALGHHFEDLLLCFDDATDKRYLLMNQVIKARVSRRREFVPLSSDNVPLPTTNAPTARKYGNTIEYEVFINHWTVCQVCKPSLGRYCSEGQRLEKEANC